MAFVTDPHVDVDGWWESAVRHGVMDDQGRTTKEFLEWCDKCRGRVTIRRQQPSMEGLITYRRTVWFEDQLDHVWYLMAFEEAPVGISTSSFDAAAFYCPYVPLTTSGVIIDHTMTAHGMQFVTRYITENKQE